MPCCCHGQVQGYKARRAHISTSLAQLPALHQGWGCGGCPAPLPNPGSALKIDTRSSNNPLAPPLRKRERCRGRGSQPDCFPAAPRAERAQHQGKKTNQRKPSYLAARAAGRAPCAPEKEPGLTLHCLGHCGWMLIQGPFPSNREVPGQHLHFDPAAARLG